MKKFEKLGLFMMLTAIFMAVQPEKQYLSELAIVIWIVGVLIF